MFASMLKDAAPNTLDDGEDAQSVAASTKKGKGRGGRGVNKDKPEKKGPPDNADEAYKAANTASNMLNSKSSQLEAIHTDLQTAKNKHYEKNLKQSTSQIIKKMDSLKVDLRQMYVKKKEKLPIVLNKLKTAAELIVQMQKHMGLLRKLG